MGKALGWLTITGLVLIVLAISAKEMEVAYPLPWMLLCTGAFCFLAGGIAWAHTQGRPRLKSALLGLVGFTGGAALGLLAGEAIIPPSGEGNLGMVIVVMILGFCGGGILFGGLGVWWVNRVHGKHDADRTKLPP